MGITMEQLHADMKQVRDRLDANSNVLAKQEGILTLIMQRLEQSASLQAQQTSQIGILTTQLEVIKSKFDSYQSDTTAKLLQLSDWQTRAAREYIPRAEHEALKIPERVEALEKFTNNTGERRLGIVKWITENSIPILLFLSNVAFYFLVTSHK